MKGIGVRNFSHTSSFSFLLTFRLDLAILKDMKRLEDAGAFGAEVECVAEDALIEIKKHTSLVIN